MCQSDFEELLLKALEIEKNEDDELKKILEAAGFNFVDLLVEKIKQSEIAIDEVLQLDYEEVLDIVTSLFSKNKKVPSEKAIRRELKKRGFNSNFSEAVIPILNETFNEVAEQMAKDLDSQFANKKLSRASKKAMEKWFKELPQLMKLTTDDAVVRAINDAYENGKGIRGLESALSKMPEFSRRRARITAITEGLSNYQAGTYEAMMQSDSVMGLKWLHTPGYPEPRQAHQALHGTVVKKGKLFNVNGYKARYPLDPSLPAGERIQCHCHVEPELDEKYLKGGEK